MINYFIKLESPCKFNKRNVHFKEEEIVEEELYEITSEELDKIKTYQNDFNVLNP